jgi:predicted transposase YdaD
MGQKDIISKQIFKRILVDVAKYIFKLELKTAELIETEHQRIEDRRSDLTAKVTDMKGEHFILHLEIQNQNHKLMPNRMLRYLNDICINYPDEEVYQYLLYIGKEPLRMADGITKVHLHYRYKVIDMHTIDYQFFMQQNSADALVLAILCDFKETKPCKVIHEILARLIVLSDNDSKVLREYVAMLEILASNRDLNVNIQQEFKMMEIEIEQLPSFLIGKERGREEGREEGIEKGIEEGHYERSVLVAKQLFQLNMPLKQIAQISGLSMKELEMMVKPSK